MLNSSDIVLVNKKNAMKKWLLIFFFLFSVVLKIDAQQKMELTDVLKHVGDTVTVCGKIYGGKFFETFKNEPTFLNVGAAYPNQVLTLVIWGDVRKLFAYKPEEALRNKDVCTVGKIETYKDKPQIVIKDPDQITVQ